MNEKYLYLTNLFRDYYKHNIIITFLEFNRIKKLIQAIKNSNLKKKFFF